MATLKEHVNVSMLHEMARKLVYLAGILDSSPNIITVLDLKKKILLYSKSGEHQLGFLKNELVGRKLSTILKRNRATRELMTQFDENSDVDEFMVTGVTKRGYEIPYSTSVRRLIGEDGQMIGYVVNMHDIHRRIELEKRQRRQYAELDSIVSNSGAMIVTTNARGRIAKINPAAERVLGVKQADMIGRTMIEYYVDKKMRRNMLTALKKDDSIEFEAEIYTAGGVVRTFHVVLSNMRSPKSGKFLGTVGISHDITKRKEAESTVHEMLITDPLTELGNRRFFFTEVQSLIEQANKKKNFCLAFVDFDSFKTYNDTLGHQAGDELLGSFGPMCERANFPKGTEFFRYGGDEFVCLLPHQSLETAAKHLDRFRKKFARHHKNLVSLSIGLSKWVPGDTVESVLNRADQAVYAAKENGRNCIFTSTGKQIKRWSGASPTNKSAPKRRRNTRSRKRN